MASIDRQKALADCEDEGHGSDFTLLEALDMEEIYQIYVQNYEEGA